MEQTLIIILFILTVALSGYSIRNDFRKAVKDQKEEDLKEKLTSPEQKIEINTQQDKRHKIFIYLALLGIFLMFFLKNTFVGYFIGFGCIILMGKNSMELGIRWSKKQPWNPKILTGSFLLLLVALSLIASLYYPQLQFMYQDRVK